ncbi:Formin-binding protein 1 [Nibea albiflora]|uniref:Formin-binding protein 1 n=1 Tax=Nibea albiflora TaxID=240163 RepID=A0ACB7FBG5_NIBAL|nr:Formin-binding protein 1 [Nibea albiflora]
MLRRKSEFFVFLDSVRAAKSQKEEQREERQLRPFEEYLQVLLQMKMTSARSIRSGDRICEKYTKFVKERSEIETNYAKQIRNLSKKYQPKKNSREEEESKYTFCRAFLSTLNELNDYAGQHEVIAENLTAQIITELSRYLQELKAERKSRLNSNTAEHLPKGPQRVYLHRRWPFVTNDDAVISFESE